MEFFSLGDCPLFIRSPDTDGVTVLDDGIQEKNVRERSREVLRSGSEISSDTLRSMLYERRAEQHISPTTRAFVLNQDAVSNARSGRVTFRGAFDVVLMSDGLFRLVDLFGAYTTEELCGKCLKDVEIDRLITELRQLESHPQSSLRHPRPKVRDDASVVVLRMKGTSE